MVSYHKWQLCTMHQPQQCVKESFFLAVCHFSDNTSEESPQHFLSFSSFSYNIQENSFYCFSFIDASVWHLPSKAIWRLFFTINGNVNIARQLCLLWQHVVFSSKPLSCCQCHRRWGVIVNKYDGVTCCRSCCIDFSINNPNKCIKDINIKNKCHRFLGINLYIPDSRSLSFVSSNIFDSPLLNVFHHHSVLYFTILHIPTIVYHYNNLITCPICNSHRFRIFFFYLSKVQYWFTDLTSTQDWHLVYKTACLC